jgi:hypothetical protein
MHPVQHAIDILEVFRLDNRLYRSFTVAVRDSG